MGADKTKDLERTVADLKKRVAALESQCKAHEAKIKFLADNTLNANDLGKYIGVHLKQERVGTEKAMAEHAKRLGELVTKQGESIHKEVTQESAKIMQQEAKKASEDAQRQITQVFRNMVLSKLVSLEADVKKLKGGR